MPVTPLSLFFWFKRVLRLYAKKYTLVSGPVWAAMLLLTALLTLSVLIGMRHLIMPDLQKVRQQDKPAALAEQLSLSAPSQENQKEGASLSKAPDNPPPAGDGKSCMPVEGLVKLDYGWQQHPVFKDWRYHVGIDIQSTASSQVKALYGGEVVNIYEDNDYGLTVIIANGDCRVYYGSLAATVLIKGQRVMAGEKVGTVGSCTGEPYPHLHLAIKIKDEYVSPREALNKAE